MPLKTARILTRSRTRTNLTEASETVTVIKTDGIEPPTKKRKRNVAPEDSSSSTAIPSLEVEETAHRLADLRLGRQLLIADGDASIVKKTGDGEYKFTVPIETLDFFHRSAWGVKDSAAEIVVNLVLLKHERRTYYGFCAHLEPGDLAEKYHHNFITTDRPWRDMIVCNKASNFLTDALSQELHGFLSRRAMEETDILGQVLAKIKEISSSDPTKSCIICGAMLRATVWRPSLCSKDQCRQSLNGWSLETRLSPFLRSPKVLDLLLACLYAGCCPNSPIGKGFIPPFFTVEELCSTIDAFPSINNDTTLSDLMLAGGGKAANEKLLSWLCTEFGGTLVPAPPSTQVGFPDSEQFLILNDPKMREIQVAKALKKKAGQGGFHGTPQYNLFSILHLGLKNTNGQVWYSSQAQYSLGFNRKGNVSPILKAPRNSAFKERTVLFGVEAVHNGGVLADQHAVNSADEATVVLRYVFVLPGDRAGNQDPRLVPFGSSLRPVMEQTFPKIRSGDLVKELETEAKKAQKS